MLSFLASFAQEESRSVSENCKWRVRKDFSEGRPMNLVLLYGYRSVKGRIVDRPGGGCRGAQRSFTDLHPADWARRLIAAMLLQRRADPTAGWAAGWSASGVIRTMLTNEKYMGDALLQKTLLARII